MGSLVIFSLTYTFCLLCCVQFPLSYLTVLYKEHWCACDQFRPGIETTALTSCATQPPQRIKPKNALHPFSSLIPLVNWDLNVPFNHQVSLIIQQINTFCLFVCYIKFIVTHNLIFFVIYISFFQTLYRAVVICLIVYLSGTVYIN